MSATSGNPDAIIEATRRGDQVAFGLLFKKHRGFVTALIRRQAVGPADVDDVVQEVFLNVFRSLPRFRGDCAFTSWLFGVTLNVVRMHFRRRNKHRNIRTAMIQRGAESDPVDTPEQLLRRREERAEIRERVARLGHSKREAVELYYLGGVPQDEVANRTGVPVGTVRTRLFYARKELRSALSA